MEGRSTRLRKLRLAVNVLLLTGCAALAAAPAGAMGMGGGREEGSGSPVKAVFTDSDGIKVAATRVTAAGVSELPGEIGRGYLRIPLSSIASIEFAGDAGASREATVKLRAGKPVVVKVRGSLTFYGHTPAGTYQIRVRDLRAIEFVE